MLAFHVDGLENPLAWRTTPSGWATRGSWVEPFRHPALEDFALLSEGRILVVIRERCAGEPRPEARHAPAAGELVPVAAADAEAVLEAMRAWPLHWATLAVTAGPPTGAVSETGSSGAAPVFAVADGPDLWGDWDPARLRAHAPGPLVDPRSAAHFVGRFDAAYSQRTIVPGMLMQTERSRLRWDFDPGSAPRLSVEYPPPVPPPLPTPLAPEADPAAAFEDILTSSLRRWLDDYEEVIAIEVSGGLDSAAAVAAANSVARAPVRSYGIALAGPCRADQRLRRGAVATRFSHSDREVDILDHLPLAAGSCRLDGGPAVPWEECYYEAADAILEQAAADGARLILTGLGGDELCGRRPGEEPAVPAREEGPPSPWSGEPSFLTDWARDVLATGADVLDPAPSPLAARSVAECIAIGSAMYMRRGLWAVHPLATPELVRFCAHLPREWRRGRKVEVTALERLGCPRAVTHPAASDDFMPALAAAMRDCARPLARRLFGESRLTELGVVDRDRLLDDYAQWCADDDIDGAMPFYAAAILELWLTAGAADHPDDRRHR